MVRTSSVLYVIIFFVIVDADGAAAAKLFPWRPKLPLRRLRQWRRPVVDLSKVPCGAGELGCATHNIEKNLRPPDLFYSRVHPHSIGNPSW